jgi:hypothetical protein
MTIVNEDSRVINKLEALLTDDTRVVIYNRHMIIVQATGDKMGIKKRSITSVGKCDKMHCMIAYVNSTLD